MRVLVAEVDSALAEFLKARFQQENFSVQVISHSDHLSSLPQNASFDLVLLDTSLPGLSAHEPVRGFLRLWPDTPVILLSAESAVEERIRGLNSGADDFLVKPFVVAELVARAHAVLRRRSRPAQDVFLFEDLQVNRVSHQVCRAGRAIELSPKEYALLEFLLRHPGRPVPRNTIIEEVWRMHGDAITNVVDVYINYLRRKIDAGSDRPLIRTIRGVGYQIGGNHYNG
jgi:two-component system, OmpR family, copper resistance phosphate regulon response regulator CusR